MELYAELSDDVTNSTDELMEAWPFEKPLTVKRSLQLMEENSAEYQPLIDLIRSRDDDRTDAEFLGKMLRAAKGQIRNGKCFTNTGGSRPKWLVQKMIG